MDVAAPEGQVHGGWSLEEFKGKNQNGNSLCEETPGYGPN